MYTCLPISFVRRCSGCGEDGPPNLGDSSFTTSEVMQRRRFWDTVNIGELILAGFTGVSYLSICVYLSYKKHEYQVLLYV